MKNMKKYAWLLLGGIIVSSYSQATYGREKMLQYMDPYDSTNYKRTIDFAGYAFKVKDSSLSETGRLGPNNNIFSDKLENVRVDAQGRLVLKLTGKNDLWEAAEVISEEDLGYGRYIFKIASRIDRLDPNITFSAFLYKDDTNEIDIEFSGFENYNSQFIIQPYDQEDHMSTYTSVLNGSYTSYVIDYVPERVTFSSYHGHNIENRKNLIHQWTYEGDDIPEAKDMKLRFNLYIRNTAAPSNGKSQEIIITDFIYEKPIDAIEF